MKDLYLIGGVNSTAQFLVGNPVLANTTSFNLKRGVMNVFPGSSPPLMTQGFSRAKNVGIGRIKQDRSAVSGQGNLTCVIVNGTL